MREYRIYHLDRTGRVTRRESVDCPDDEAALAQLTARQDGLDAELWDGGRLVRRLDKA